MATSACGAPPEPQAPGNDTPAPAPKAAETDLSTELPKVELKGTAYRPEGLGRPPMPIVEGKKKVTIEKQRTIVAKAKEGAIREAMSQILATLLYQASKAESGGKETALLEEGRSVMREALKTAASPPDSNTLRMLGVFEILLGDYAAATKAWEQLTNLDPADKEVDHFRAWWAYSALTSGDEAGALAALKGFEPDLKSPELAYMMAWVRWRAGDNAGAWKALRAAAIGWPEKVKGSVIERDLILLAGRTFAPIEEAVAVATAFAGPAKADQYAMLFKISQSMTSAGRYQDTIAAIDAALRAVGTEVPKQDPPKLRFQQAELTLRFDDPVAGARFGKQAINALLTCGDACTDRADVAAAIQRIATFYHSIYATSQDIRFYAPAREIYSAVIGASEGEKKAEVLKLSDQLDKTKRAIRPGGGIHDKEIVAALLGLHAQEILACYEATLAGNPKVTGSLVLSLEFDAKGGVTGATSTPPAGEDEVAEVAECSLERARLWRLPARGKPGVTRVKLSYELSSP
ncbi:MAG: hypothetical protein R3B48_20775 [Kofleriaceae bacterium]